jgi:hypothetical protein
VIEMLTFMFLVLVAGAGVVLVATLARVADLALLPRHKRARVEWCRLHSSQVAGACGALLAVLVAIQVALPGG